MDTKLQQAIVATRAGEQEFAQHLLADSLQENPQETEAWFLMAHLAKSPERQALYLMTALALQPDHAVAGEHLKRLQHPDVPAPVIKAKASDKGEQVSEPTTPPPDVDSDFLAIPPARTAPAITAAAAPVTDEQPTLAASAAPVEPAAASVVPPQDSKRIDADWQRTAGAPKRVSDSSAVLTPSSRPVRQDQQPTVLPTVPYEQPAKTTSQMQAVPDKAQPVAPAPRKPNKWLLAILLILVAITFFALSFLAYTIFFT